MPVDLHIQTFLDKYNALPQTPLDTIQSGVMRKTRSQNYNFAIEIEEVKKVENRILPLDGRNIPVRVYTPEGKAPYPALVYYHGGGWTIGSLDSHDSVCRALANLAQCVVISVDYRLAPEHKFPAGVNDAYDSLQWIATHAEEFGIDSNRIAVGGDSAGGNLAAVACIIAKEQNSPKIVYQLLIYPSTGHEGEEPRSMRENAKGYFLTTEMMQWFHKHYFTNDEEIQHPYASPILHSDLSGLPRTMIITAEYDPLRDIGKAYADKLEENGVKVVYKNYEGMIHGFVNFHPIAPKAQEALKEIAQQLQNKLKVE